VSSSFSGTFRVLSSSAYAATFITVIKVGWQVGLRKFTEREGEGAAAAAFGRDIGVDRFGGC